MFPSLGRVLSFSSCTCAEEILDSCRDALRCVLEAGIFSLLTARPVRESFCTFTNLEAFCCSKVVDFRPFAGEGDVLHVQTCSEGKVFVLLKCLVQRGWQSALTLVLQRPELGQGLNKSWGSLEKSALFFLIKVPKSFTGNAVDCNIASLSEG